jgi:hypothetical protein
MFLLGIMLLFLSINLTPSKDFGDLTFDNNSISVLLDTARTGNFNGESFESSAANSNNLLVSSGFKTRKVEASGSQRFSFSTIRSS